jgi:ribonuclease BN (tRNA processing enzyme)
VIVTFVGCGDAFGSGGRAHTCFHVQTDPVRFLIDCGASSLSGLKRLQIDLNAIEVILITHFHADHFGGVPFFMLDAQFFSKRRTPLTIVGPVGLSEWYVRVMETAFPGSSQTPPKFDLLLRDIHPGQTLKIGALEVSAFQAKHGPGDEGPFVAYRVGVDGKVIAYTGDTEWTDVLVPAARDADLFIAEAYFRDKDVKYHLSLAQLEQHVAEIAPRRVILTHMSDDMLQQRESVPWETAHDGLIVSL